MMPNILLKHPAIQYANEMADICNPLKKLNITYFAHVHVDNNKKFSALTNNPHFAEHYLKHKYYNVDIHMAEEKFGDFMIWDTVEHHGLSEKMNEEAEQFGVKHTYTIFDTNENGKDYYHFGTHLSSKSINQIYITHMDLLKLFILYFKENVKHSKKLTLAYRVKLGIDLDAPGYTIQSANITNHEKIRFSFLRDILENKGKKYFFSSSILKHATLLNQTNGFLSNEKNIIELLSKREKECLYFTLKGKTAKQIATALNLSYRTVEEYLTNIKSKMGIASKSEMIEKIIESITIYP